MFRRKQEPGKRSFLSRLSGIASIISAVVVSVRLAWMGLISAEVAAMIMVAVVIMVAIGNVATKLGISAIAIYLFSMLVSQGDKARFHAVLSGILTLIVIMIGLYVMIRGIFRGKS